MFCNNCGKEISNDTKFCPHCGNAINATGGDTFQRDVNNFSRNVDSQFESSVNEIRNDFRGNSNYNPNGGGAILRTDRSLLMYILLSFITCGIYGYYFIYTIARDINIACQGDGENTGGLAAFIILSFITCGFYALWWEYKLANRIQANGPRYGLVIQENGTTVLMWYIFGSLLCCIGTFIAQNILIKNVNTICAAYNRSHNM